MFGSESAMKKVSLGLTILYYNLCLLLICIILPNLGSIFASTGRPPEVLVEWTPKFLLWLFWYFFVIFPFLNLAGRLLCFFNTPAVGSAKKLVTVCFALDAISLLLAVTGILIAIPSKSTIFGDGLGFAGRAVMVSAFSPHITTVISGYVSLASAGLFLIYLIWLAKYIKRNGLAMFAKIVLVGSVICFALTYYLGHGNNAYVVIRHLGPIAGLIFTICLFAVPLAMYGRLLTMLRGAIIEEYQVNEDK